MRTDASTIIGSYVETAMAGIARSRPGGAPPLPVRPASETADQRSAEEVRDYETYLGSIGHQDDVPWVESAVKDRAAIKRVTDIGLNHGVLSLGGALSAGAAEEAGALPLFSILAVALLGGLAAFVLRMPALQTEGRLKPFTVAGLAVAGLCGFLLMAVYAAGPAMLQQCIAPSIDADQSASSPHETAIIHAVFALLMLAVPLAMTLHFAIRNRRAPMATGIVRGFAGSALRVCSLLALLYLPAVLIGGQVESHALADLERCVRYGEGSYFSSVSGIVWPTYAPKEA